MKKKIHCDPGMLLALDYLENECERRLFLQNLTYFIQKMDKLSDQLQLMLCKEHSKELIRQFTGRFYSNDKREKILRPILIRFIGKRILPIHEFGSSEKDANILNKLRDTIIPDDDSVVIAWADFLSSDLLKIGNVYVTGFTDSTFGLLNECILEVNVNKEIRSYTYVKSIDDLVTHFNLVDPDLVNSLKVDKEPSFIWEKTGHGPTRLQKKVVIRTAKKSGIVYQSITTYQNPQLGIKTSYIGKTNSLGEFEFTVSDGSNVLKGIFKTNANTDAKSATALLLLQRELEHVGKP